MSKITITTTMLCYSIALRVNKNAGCGVFQFYTVLSNVTDLHP